MSIKAYGTVTVINVDDGINGQKGDTGVSVSSVTPMYYLSTSATKLQGGSWLTTKPEITTGKYLWTKQRTTFSDNTTKDSTAIYDATITGVESRVSSVENTITNKVWSSDISSAIQAFDNGTDTTHSTIRDRITQTETDITGIRSSVTDIETSLNDKADGSTVSAISTRVSTLEQDVSGFHTTVENTYATKTENTTTLNTAKTYAEQLSDRFYAYVEGAGGTSSITLTNKALEAITNQFIVKDPNGNSTIISGGRIYANSITTAMLATDAIKSTNYTKVSGNTSAYSNTGSYFNLSTGNIETPNFAVDNTNSKAYINGEIIATSGSIGNSSTNYWEIGTKTDYNMAQSAALIAHGSSYIQSGQFMIHDDKVNTQSYAQNRTITHPHYEYYYNYTTNVDNAIDTYYDFGMQAPQLNTTSSGYVAGISDLFLYGRRHKNNIPVLETDWEYFFKIDKKGDIYTQGAIYEKGIPLSQRYASISDVDGSYLPKTGGTITGNLTVNGTLTATLANLSINGKTYNNTSSVNVGTIGVAYGGTGATTLTSGQVLIGNGTSAVTTRAIKDYTSVSNLGWTSSNGEQLLSVNALAYWNGRYNASASNLQYWKGGEFGTMANESANDYIQITGGTVSGALIINAELQADSISSGNLIVNGVGRFNNGLYGNLTGNADTATKATQDSAGNTINTTYIKGLSVDGQTITITKGDNTTTTITTQDTNTDTLVKQDYSTTNNSYPVLMSATAGVSSTSSRGAKTTIVNNGLYANPSTGKITATGGFVGNLEGNANTATLATTANTWTNSITITIGNTGKSVNGSGNITWSKADVSGNASSSDSGWMSSDDKAKLDAIKISDIDDVISADSIIGTSGIDVSIVSGVATISGLFKVPTASGNNGQTIISNGTTGVWTDFSASLIKSGTLPVARGGTGQTSAVNAANAFLNALSTGSTTPVDADYYISQYVGGGTTTTTYHRRPMSALWSYVKGKISSDLGLTASTYEGKAASAVDDSHNHTSATIKEKDYVWTGDVFSSAKINTLRANRFALLPADQIIIEKTTDGGVTWVDGGFSDATKRALFVGNTSNSSVYLPLLNGVRSKLCGIRITITAMKYNVPQGTSEIEKYNYWNSTYLKSTERYCSLSSLYFWVTVIQDRMSLKIEKATGANPNNWIQIHNLTTSDKTLKGWSGGNVINNLNNTTFGGSSTQVNNYWNYRFTFFTTSSTDGGDLSTQGTTSQQAVYRIYGYGSSIWTSPNNLASIDHLYNWDTNQNAIFPAAVTATSFNGNATSATTATSATLATQDGDGNTISSTYLKLSGGTVTGTLVLSKTTDASGTSDNACALKIGNTVGQHLEFDDNEIMSKSSGTAPNTLYLNTDGGLISTGSGGINTSGEITIGSHANLRYDSTIEALCFSFV